MSVQSVKIRIKGGPESNFDAATLMARELAVTTDTGKLFIGNGDGTARHLNDIPKWVFGGNLVLVSGSGGTIVESSITVAQLAVLAGLDATLTGIATDLDRLEDGLNGLGTMADEDVADYYTKTELQSSLGDLTSNKLERADLRPGANVVLTPGEGRSVTIAVPGVPIPAKFAAQVNGTGAIGDIGTYNFAGWIHLSGDAPESKGDVIIFANGYQAEILSVNTAAQTVEAVIISIPQSIAWGGIGGVLNAQVDLIEALNTKVDKTTRIANKPLSGPHVFLDPIRIFTDTEAGTISYDGSNEVIVPLGEIVNAHLLPAVKAMSDIVADGLDTKISKIDLLTIPVTPALVVTAPDGNVIPSDILVENVITAGTVLDGGTF